jgi:Pentapeptide repeats (8 copies)
MRGSPLKSRPRAALGSCLIVLLLVVVAAPGAGAVQPIEGKPRMLALHGFAYPVDMSLSRWRVGAVMVTRYPKVVPRAFSARVRKLLSFRTQGKLKVFRHRARIASTRDSGGLPVTIEGRALTYAHLFAFSGKQSQRILGSSDALQVLSGSRVATGSLNATADSIERVRGEGKTLARASTQTSQRVAESQEPPPRVVKGCVLKPFTECYGLNLSGGDLSGANLNGAVFTSARLDGANLTGAVLTSSQFAGVNFAYANLTDANLRGAQLLGAYFRGANLTGADLAQAHLHKTYFCHTTMPDGTINNSDCRD